MADGKGARFEEQNILSGRVVAAMGWSVGTGYKPNRDCHANCGSRHQQ
jgi:hypothetical protein